MKCIGLTQGKVAMVDDEDYVWLCQWKWNVQKCVCKNRVIWYAKRNAPTIQGGQRTIYMHREIAAVAGIPQVDHRDGNGLNNQRINLRPATRSQNLQSRHKQPGCTSKIKGVCWEKRRFKWKAYICVNGREVFLGYFEQEQDAGNAHDKAAVHFFKDFALVNSVKSDQHEAQA